MTARPPDPAGMAALEEVLEDLPDHACALVVALAHLDIAWAWHTIRFETDGTETSLTRPTGISNRRADPRPA